MLKRDLVNAAREARQQAPGWHVIDRRDGERVAGGFVDCAEAEAWIEKTDRRGSGEFEAVKDVAAERRCRNCSQPWSWHSAIDGACSDDDGPHPDAETEDVDDA